MGGAGHFVIRMEGRDVPGNIGGDAGQEFGNGAQFGVGIVEAGDYQRDHLQPESHLVDAADGIENRRQPAAQLMIAAVVEALEIYLI